MLALVLVGSTLAIGTVHPTTMLAVAMGAGAALALAAGDGLDNDDAPSLWPAVTLLALAAFTAVQLLPLPLSWLRVLATTNADIWERALLPLGETPGYTPISLDPGATMMEVLRWMTYAAVYVAAVVVARERSARFGVLLVFVSAVIAALTTVTHGLVGAEKVYGLYEPSFRPRPWHVGPLLNPNNLSGYLNLGLFCGFGLVLSDKAPAPRWLLGVGIAVILGVNVTTSSRAGLAVLLVALMVFGLVIEATRWRSIRRRPLLLRARVIVGSTLALGLVLAFLAGTKEVWNEIVDKNLEKLAMWDWLWEMAGSYPWLGTGRGAFESVSPAFQPGRSGVVYTHAENFVFQWIIEWGAPVALGALVAFGFQLRPRRLGVGRSALAAGAWVGTIALLLHSLLDLALEVPAVMIALVVVVGSLRGDSRLSRTRREAPRLGSSALERLIAASALAFVGALAGTALMSIPDLATEREQVQTALLASTPPRTAEQQRTLRERLRAAMKRHPADPYFPLIGATAAWQDRSENPIPWLQRTLERALINGRAHLLLAYVLRELGSHRQSLLELRLAVDGDPELVNVAARLALSWSKNIDDVLVAVPTGDARAQSLDSLGRMATDREVGRACDELALEANPGLLGPRERLARDVIDKLDSAACRGADACDRELNAHIEALETTHPTNSTAPRLRALRLAALGKADEAERHLAEACTRVDDRSPCLRARMNMAKELDDRERLIAAAKAWKATVCARRKRCAQAALTVGDIHAGRKEWGAAMENYKQAARDDESVAALSRLASAASSAGMHGQAVRALERALELPGAADDAQLEKRLAAARQKLVRPLIER